MSGVGVANSFFGGVLDALLGLSRVAVVIRDSHTIRKKLFETWVLNGIVLACSVITFDNVIIPLLHLVIHDFILPLLGVDESQLQVEFIISLVSYLFSALWVLPLFWLNKPISSVWFLEIADEVLRQMKEDNRKMKSKVSKGRKKGPDVSKWIADMLFSLVLECLFLFQAMLVGFIPAVGVILSLSHLTLLYSLYSFEYAWMDHRLSVNQRIAMIEENWPYFVGFGLPLTVATALPRSFIISACVFAVLFPLFLIIACDTEPRPADVFRLRAFRVVEWLGNVIFSRLGSGVAMKAEPKQAD
ncbi:etoposide-induced protein 2.4 homolog [Corticium candelabrum]|uniref:etoposide-induced protein 2.4 homolog n=1 Tax=Corticium candelabrum TaxID=121492 RepID=UPI002E25D5EB|nr:etoposide-induced protein 2.4 homolog [Corticium candelabrum]